MTFFTFPNVFYLFISFSWFPASIAGVLPNGVEPSAGCKVCKSSLTFSNPAAAQFAVGTNIPLLPFKTKPSWAGNIAVPDTPTLKNGSLFFWLWGQDSQKPSDDLIIWLNGGPGCSSIGSGLVSENGPFLIQSSNEGPTRPNPNSFTLAADMLYVAHPSGVAFTTGNRSCTNEEQISEQFNLWLHEFFKVFPELSKKNLYLVGESYAGMYTPGIYAKYKKNPPNGINRLAGGMLVDPLISNEVVQTDIPMYYFALKNKNTLKLTEEDLSDIKNKSDNCDFNAYLDRNLRYPPKGRLPPMKEGQDCNVRGTAYEIFKTELEAFNYYNIKKPDPKIVDKNVTMSRDIFLSDKNVQKYIHVKEAGPYIHCRETFVDDTDTSLPVDRDPSFQHPLLAQLIESSKRFYILNGDLDAVIPTNGTKLVLQNLTWNGAQGFTKPAHIPLTDLSGHKQAIATEEERGLRFIEVINSGHKIPMDQGSFALAAILALLGKRKW